MNEMIYSQEFSVMNMTAMIERIENHRDSENIGMILSHIGIVRGVSRDGQKVSMIEMTVDHDRLNEIVLSHKQMPGIVEILVETSDRATLFPGDRIMLVAVAGDIRENVLGTMTSIINAIKQDVTHKTEHYA